MNDRRRSAGGGSRVSGLAGPPGRTRAAKMQTALWLLAGAVVALVGFSEGWGASGEIAKKTHDDLDTNQEFRAYGAGNIGAYEAALLDTPMANAEQPLEILRTIHSFDPCLACSTHVMSPDGEILADVKVR